MIFSRKGWVRARQGWEVDPTTLSFKEGDELLTMLQCRTVDPVIFLDSKGRAYTVQAGELPPARGDGAPASSLVDVQEGALIMYTVAGKPGTNVMVASTGGYGFLCTHCRHGVEPACRPRVHGDRGGRDPGGARHVRRVAEELSSLRSAEQGRMLLFHVSEMKQMSKGRGVVIMGLEKGEKLLAVAVSDQPGLIVTGTSRGKDKQITIEGKKLAHYAGHRARMGRVLPDKLKPVKLTMLPKPVPPADA